jgi:hypothetical protein
MLLLVWVPAALLVVDQLWRRFGHFKLGAHLLDLRCLFFQVCRESFTSPVLLCGSRFLLRAQLI